MSGGGGGRRLRSRGAARCDVGCARLGGGGCAATIFQEECDAGLLQAEGFDEPHEFVTSDTLSAVTIGACGGGGGGEERAPTLVAAR